MQKGEQLYTRTPIYEKGPKPSVPKEKSVTTSVPPQYETTFETVVEREDREHKIKLREKRSKRNVHISVCDSKGNTADEGRVRVAAWIANQLPFTRKNALINALTNKSGCVLMRHECKPGTDVLIRARVISEGTFVGPTRQYVHTITDLDNEIIKIKL